MVDVKEKIRKLLRLANNPNENEAKAALLKARELMAQYKFSEKDVLSDDTQFCKVELEYTFTKTTNSWMPQLAAVIAKEYYSKSVFSRSWGRKTYAIELWGTTADVEVCKEVLTYSMEFVLNCCAKIKKSILAADLTGQSTAKKIRNACNGFGLGFALGVDEAFTKQNQENPAYALVLSVPKKVEDECSNHSNLKFTPQYTSALMENRAFFYDGFEKGYEFQTRKAIKKSA